MGKDFLSMTQIQQKRQQREEREGRRGKRSRREGRRGKRRRKRERRRRESGKFDSEGINTGKNLINKIKMQWKKIQNLQFKSQTKSKLS